MGNFIHYLVTSLKKAWYRAYDQRAGRETEKRVLTLANPQTFGFEFHLRSLPSCANSGRSVSQSIACCMLHRTDETQPGFQF